VVALKSQLAAAERQLHAQPSQVNAGSETVPNPTYQQLDQQATTLQSTASGARAEVATLESQRKSMQPRLERLPEQARRIGDLQREAKTAEAVYDALSRKYQEAVIAKTTALSDVTITQAADASVYTVSPNLALNMILGIVVGLGLALTAAFGADFFDNRFRSEDDVRDRLGLPVLASVPQIESNDWRANQWVKPLSVEAFYQLVAALRYSSDKPSRSIAFISCDPGDGKSTVAVNTAISMGLMKARVLIVDADLRRPAVHDKLNLQNDRGLSDVLVGVSRFEEAVKATRHLNVWALTAGRPAPNPVGLLQGDGFTRLLRKASERFDFIIIDTPALRAIVDGAVLARQADGAVLVVSAQRSDARSVQAGLTKLQSLGPVNILGAVLNGATPDSQALGYYAGTHSAVPLAGTANEA
jgi:succinoglycan biosynthesis transport protein ExoP